MTNKFNISLGGKVSAESINKSLENLVSSGQIKPIKVKVEIDTSSLGELQTQLKKLGELANLTSKSKTKSSTSSGTIDNSFLSDYGENKITTDITKGNKVIGQRVELVKNLRETATAYYSATTSGELKLERVTTTSNTGLKENLKIQEQNVQLLEKARGRIDAYASQAKLSKKEVAAFNKQLSQIATIEDAIQRNDALRKLNIEVRNAADSVGILGQSITSAAKKFTLWYLLAGVVTSIPRMIKSVVEQVTALDTALTELKKVTDTSSAGLEKLKKQAFAVGEQLGSTGENVLKAITEFARSGYSLDESLGLAKVAITLTNVAENITDAGDAAQYLLSILKGANLEVSQANMLLDELNQISNNFAVDLGSLADMVQRITGTMSNFGNSVEETMALVTGAYEVLQDERVARGISTIAARIAGLNEDLEAEEGLANDVSEALQKYARINVFDMNGQLRDTYDILEELAGKWDNLSKNAQSVLLNIVAGKNRMDVLSSILTNWDNVAASLQATTEAEGSAAQEQAVYLDSIQGRLETMSNAWQKLADTTLSSDFLKILIDIGTALIDITTQAGGLLNVITLIAGTIGVVKLSKFFAEMKKGNIVIKQIGQAANASARAVTALKVALAGINLILSAISLVVGVIFAIINAVKARQEAEEQARQERIQAVTEDIDSLETLRQKYIEVSSTISDINEQNEQLKSNYEDLEKLAKRYGVALTDANGQQKSFLELQQEVNKEALKEKMQLEAPEVSKAKEFLNTKSYFAPSDNEETLKKVAREKGLYDKKITQEERLSVYKTALDRLSEKGYDNLSKAEKDQYNSYVKEINELTKKIEEAKATLSEFNELSNQLEFTEKFQGDLNELSETYSKWATGTEEEMAFGAKNMLEEIDAFVKKVSEALPDYAENVESAVAEMRKKVESSLRSDIVLTALEKKRTALEKQKKLDEEELKIQEKLLKVEKARAALEEARTKRISVFRAGKGMVFEQDFSSIQEAQENLNKAIRDADGTDVDKAIDNIDTLIDAYNNGLASEAETGSEKIREYFNNATNYAEFFASTFEEKLRKLAELGAKIDETTTQKESTKGYLAGQTSSYSISNGTDTISRGVALALDSQELRDKVTNKTINNSTGSINIGNISLPNVSDVDGFIDEMKTISYYKKPNLG